MRSGALASPTTVEYDLLFSFEWRMRSGVVAFIHTRRIAYEERTLEHNTETYIQPRIEFLHVNEESEADCIERYRTKTTAKLLVVFSVSHVMKKAKQDCTAQEQKQTHR